MENPKGHDGVEIETPNTPLHNTGPVGRVVPPRAEGVVKINGNIILDSS